MPSRNQIDRKSLRSRIRVELALTPNGLRPAEVAAALGVPADFPAGPKPAKSMWTIRVGAECARMAKEGVLLAVQEPPAEGKTRPVTRYKVPTAVPAEK